MSQWQTDLVKGLDDERPGWRKVLSNFHIHRFSMNGKDYDTVEAAYHACKLERYGATEDVLAKFTEIGLTGPRARRMGGKHGLWKLDSAQLQDWTGEPHRAAMRKCLEAALSLHNGNPDQHKRQIMADLAELGTEFWHIPGRGKQAVRVSLMEELADRILHAGDA